MASSSVRRTFHGPWLSAPQARRFAAPPRPPLELVPAPPEPDSGALGRELLRVAREEEPTSAARERILNRVLSALQHLTSEGSKTS
jgi:hypothetical protein